ncbi:lysophospholipid acyltransferase family protein [Neorickettsia risticii]|uniref:1-acyl-sn-glycerol-3-phosphate acyltransferase family protein n=1 Tax=Neorickettsia risticii (strain Illinois) TaxID=434131 RepID=C6V4Q4_NEORI|nr:lysophospholipid acyltransferase family protein [Neorickettsia risticii]ACT69326.1 1-acyl-sn-glycerol-3-phosphate acyltransferase family protein [Neorickettsia risticii str. Illinois]
MRNKGFFPSAAYVTMNFLFNVSIVIWTALYGLLVLPALFLPPEDVIEVRRVWIRGIFVLLRFFFNIEFEIRGGENIHLHKQFIVASKHHSPLDVILLADLFKKPVFVLKRSLIFIPIFGLYMIATKMITVSYSAKSNGLDVLRKMVRQAKVLSKNRTIILYPEGGRTKIGEEVEYKRGILALYKHLNLPVLPIALNVGQIWPVGYFSNKQNGKAVVQILPPIMPGLKDDEFLQVLRDAIESNTKRLLNSENKHLLTLQKN